MRRIILISLVLCTGLAAVAADRRTPASAPAGGSSPTWESYAVILTRNVFVRDRAALSHADRTPTSQPAKTSAQSLVLTGVAFQTPDTFAFFEDTRSGDTLRVAVGQAVGNGTLASVSLDSIEYRDGDATRKISIGETLGGEAVSLVYSPPTSQPTTDEAGQPASQPASTGNISSNDLLERMRQRRLQENR